MASILENTTSNATGESPFSNLLELYKAHKDILPITLTLDEDTTKHSGTPTINVNSTTGPAYSSQTVKLIWSFLSTHLDRETMQEDQEEISQDDEICIDLKDGMELESGADMLGMTPRTSKVVYKFRDGVLYDTSEKDAMDEEGMGKGSKQEENDLTFKEMLRDVRTYATTQKVIRLTELPTLHGITQPGSSRRRQRRGGSAAFFDRLEVSIGEQDSD